MFKLAVYKNCQFWGEISRYLNHEQRLALFVSTMCVRLKYWLGEKITTFTFFYWSMMMSQNFICHKKQFDWSGLFFVTHVSQTLNLISVTSIWVSVTTAGS